ncbi:NAD(P)-dependent oxidoreductase [Goodfellowiella coeruleoviolacea]|uniref:NAD(P)-dependent oxidoreductase n=1 Tax=Goodfellowiella coeruleoviolacea TaxID=334858 RepID=UPI0020A60CE4|nr:NAD(P)-binding domain-containing protein [Goodfellowiella coeruleoviolacea]
MTVVGLGPMGAALAEALLANGNPTTVWNRTAGKADRLVARGARRAASAAEAVAASPVTIVCVADYPAMHAVLEPASGALAGRTVVNLSSGTPEQARDAVAWAEQRGARYLDGVIMVPPEAIGRPDTVLFYSGQSACYDAHRATLDVLGGAAQYLGDDPGLAVLYNTALLGLMYATINGFLHAAALVGSAGVASAALARIAGDWFVPSVVLPLCAGVTGQIDSGDFPGDAGDLRAHLTVIDHIVRTSRDQGMATDVPGALRDLVERAIAEGYGDKGYASLVELIRTPAG